MGRAPCCEKNGLKKGPWTPEEDKKLIDYIHKHGYGNWRTLPKIAGLQRCGKSCRLRWTNYLRPDIKRGRFSFEEEETIIQLHSILGNKWSTIAARLPGRTDNEIKNYWNTHIRKRLLRMGIDPVTHSPRLDLLDLSSILGSSSLYNSSQMNMSRFLGVQNFVNPELFHLATSLMSSRRNKNPNFLVQENQIVNPQMQNQIPQIVQIQAPLQQIENTPCVTFASEEEQELMESNAIRFMSQNSELVNDWQTNEIGAASSNFRNDYVPLPSYDYYQPSDQPVTTDPSSGQFANSVLSTPSSNSNSTHLNSCNEDEREIISYCSDLLKFDYQDIIDVNQLMLSESNLSDGR